MSQMHKEGASQHIGQRLTTAHRQVKPHPVGIPQHGDEIGGAIVPFQGQGFDATVFEAGGIPMFASC